MGNARVTLEIITDSRAKWDAIKAELLAWAKTHPEITNSRVTYQEDG